MDYELIIPFLYIHVFFSLESRYGMQLVKLFAKLVVNIPDQGLGQQSLDAIELRNEWTFRNLIFSKF